MTPEGPTARTIREKLETAFAPERLEVIDDSRRHAGHAGASPDGESHFNVVIIATAFKGLSRVERQRRVHATLKAELSGPVHALSVRAMTPDEAV